MSGLPVFHATWASCLRRPRDLRHRRRLAVEIERLRAASPRPPRTASRTRWSSPFDCAALARATMLPLSSASSSARSISGSALSSSMRADVDPRQLERGPCLVILPPGSPRGLERLLLVLLGLRHRARPTARRERGGRARRSGRRGRRLRRPRAPRRRAPPRGRARRRSEAATSESAVSARLWIVAVALRRGLLGEDGHLVANDRQISELPRGARREVAALERRLELDRAEQQLARREVRLARERALARRLECLRRRPRQLLGRLPVELGVEQRRPGRGGTRGSRAAPCRPARAATPRSACGIRPGPTSTDRRTRPRG